MQTILIYDDNVCNHSLEKKEVSKDLINKWRYSGQYMYIIINWLEHHPLKNYVDWAMF